MLTPDWTCALHLDQGPNTHITQSPLCSLSTLQQGAEKTTWRKQSRVIILWLVDIPGRVWSHDIARLVHRLSQRLTISMGNFTVNIWRRSFEIESLGLSAPLRALFSFFIVRYLHSSLQCFHPRRQRPLPAGAAGGFISADPRGPGSGLAPTQPVLDRFWRQIHLGGFSGRHQETRPDQHRPQWTSSYSAGSTPRVRRMFCGPE